MSSRQKLSHHINFLSRLRRWKLSHYEDITGVCMIYTGKSYIQRGNKGEARVQVTGDGGLA